MTRSARSSRSGSSHHSLRSAPKAGFKTGSTTTVTYTSGGVVTVARTGHAKPAKPAKVAKPPRPAKVAKAPRKAAHPRKAVTVHKAKGPKKVHTAAKKKRAAKKHTTAKKRAPTRRRK